MDDLGNVGEMKKMLIMKMRWMLIISEEYKTKTKEIKGKFYLIGCLIFYLRQKIEKEKCLKILINLITNKNQYIIINFIVIAHLK